MFKRFFKKNRPEDNSSNENMANNGGNNHLQSFQFLVASCLNKNGVNEKCNVSKNEKWNKAYEDNSQALLKAFNYDESFEIVLLEELKRYKNSTPYPSKTEFIQNYFSTFHHIKLSKHTPEFIQETNNKLLKAYNQIVECINRIQGWMNDERLRAKIESDSTKSPYHLSTIYQCTTPFCVIALGCDPIGRYNIEYSLDYRIKDLIGGDFSSTLIRRINQFTSGEMEPFVNIRSLKADCIEEFKDMLQWAKMDDNHKIYYVKRFEGEGFFKKNSPGNNSANENKVNYGENNYLQTFQLLVASCLNKNGVNEQCNIPKNENWAKDNEDDTQALSEELNYNEMFEIVILEELEKYKKLTLNPSKTEFIQNYFLTFHHKKLSKHTPAFIQERNNKISKAYDQIIEAVNRIRGWMDDEKLRIKIESDYTNSPYNLSKIYQCTTLFCVVSLGCDQMGRYNIVYSLDYRIKDMIGRDFSSTFIRRIYQFTSGDMEPFVNIGSLYAECSKDFDAILQLAKTEGNHKVFQKDRNEEKSINDILQKLELRDDIDEETKKWFNK